MFPTTQPQRWLPRLLCALEGSGRESRTRPPIVYLLRMPSSAGCSDKQQGVLKCKLILSSPWHPRLGRHGLPHTCQESRLLESRGTHPAWATLTGDLCGTPTSRETIKVPQVPVTCTRADVLTECAVPGPCGSTVLPATIIHRLPRGTAGQGPCL